MLKFDTPVVDVQPNRNALDEISELGKKVLREKWTIVTESSDVPTDNGTDITNLHIN
jgi:hypothetical protein